MVVYEAISFESVLTILRSESGWILTVESKYGSANMTLTAHEMARLVQIVCHEVLPGYTPAFYIQNGDKIQAEHLFGAEISRLHLTTKPDSFEQQSFSFDLYMAEASFFEDRLLGS